MKGSKALLSGTKYHSGTKCQIDENKEEEFEFVLQEWKGNFAC